MGAARVILALSLPGGYALPIGMCVLLMILVFIALYLLSLARAQSERELRALLRRDPRLYIERLENNRRLKLVFRPAVLLLYKLEGYMSLNDDGKCRELIAKLDGMKLQPRDRLQFYQTKLSFYAYAGDGEQAKATLTQLEDFLHKSGADEVDQYKKLLRQARQIVAVYVDKDISMLPKLQRQAAATKDGADRGLLQFRIAKLSHYAGNEDQAEVYLNRAAKNLKNTAYSVIIDSALEDHSVLERY
ncbi:MAG: hypothetical protein MSS54_02425 [Clostridiales bacterium]|nr:hypothetical protein [Clostridiales bacterium]MDY4225067.1 hypothetical protein [Candidatus Limivicinus sp.]